MLGKSINQISVVHRLYIGFAVLTLVIAMGGGAALLLAQQINSSFNTLTENSARTQLLANQVGSQALRSGIRLLAIDNAASLSELEELNSQAQLSLNGLEEDVSALEEHASKYNLGELNQHLDDVKRVENTLSTQGENLAQLQRTFLQQDQKVRNDVSDFLFQLSDLKRIVNSVSGPSAAEDSYIQDVLTMVMDRFGLIEFLLSNMVNTREPEKVADLVKKIQYNSKVFNDDFESLTFEVEGLADPKITELITWFNKQINDDSGIVERYIGSQETIADITKQTVTINQQLSGLDSVIVKIVGLANQQSEVASEQGRSLILNARSITAVVVPLVIIFAIAVAYWLASLIRKPLEHTQSQILLLAEGNYSQTMQGKYSGEFGVLVAAINRMIEQARDVFSQIQSAAHQLSDVSVKNNEASSVVKTKLDKQTAELNSVATAVTEMESAIKEVASNTESSRELSMSVESNIDQGQQVMNQNIEMIDSLDDALQSTSGQVDKLADASKQIGSIIEVIDGIAEKTNLLALNAAIEAARAGEQGRGFAVVADEVRSLASQTTKSTESVRAMITTLQRESTQVFDAMAASRDQMSQSKELAEKSREAIMTIRTDMSQMREMTDQISVAAQEQHHVASEVTRNVNVIAEVAEDNFEQIERVAQSSEALQQQVNDIETMLKRFILK
ncbi:HAMP domain-containing methyl-accepting chemotaxis protein [Agarivorans aestuarii]|uniref:HAMP domain-containing methyl-accepting chemotaxis protein n=1 Tax=Agarivorans aestuarii TaxID=1563703 RepID=A0ABU7G5F3_9ALTE|nr:HAMP domain-containing methyl-accepting chemotaxis protein [Agarivorans aestuarii]MEE1674543.1 HAMP domain-containing methyl-accepting chemotaxis protein [Agarivorans aestuarii]